jgi:hypothetical protein
VDNRPVTERVVTAFMNLQSDPVEVSVPVGRGFTNWFTGEKVPKGTFTATLAPGQYIVLTK